MSFKKFYPQNISLKWHEWVVVGFLLLCFAWQSIYLIRTSSAVEDEIAHIAAGYTYLKFKDFTLNPEHPPFVKKLAAWPLLSMNLRFPDLPQGLRAEDQWRIGRTFLFASDNPADEIIEKSRLALLPLALFLGGLIFLAAYDFFGKGAAFFSIGLYAFFPELIAHSGLVTTDFAASVFFFATAFFLGRYYRFELTRDIWLAAALGGLAMGSKFSMLLLIPVFYLFSALCSFRKNSPQKEKQISWVCLVLALLFALMNQHTGLILSAPLIYFFWYKIYPHPRRFFDVQIRKSVNELLILLAGSFLVVLLLYFSWPMLKSEPHPLGVFFSGFDVFQKHAHEKGHLGYLFGKWSTEGWWYYYLVAIAVKTPVPILISGLAGSIYFGFFSKISRMQKIIFLGMPFSFWCAASFLNSVHIGARHIMPVFPFLLVLAGAVVPLLKKISSKTRWSLFLPIFLLVWTASGSLRVFPAYLSYFNEFATMMGGGARILSDSNITWGQDLKRLKKYTDARAITNCYFISMYNEKEETNYYQIPCQAGEKPLREKQPGLYIMGVFDYQGLLYSGEFEWLRALRPFEKIGDSLLVFRVGD